MKRFSLVMTFVLGACGGGGGGDIVGETCDRGDECNRLPGSHDECIEYFDSCLDNLTPSQRDEWEYQMQQCLDRPSCDGAFDCYEQVPWC